MNRYAAGVIAGFVATLVLSAMMIAKATMGLMPDLNVIAMLTTMAHQKMGMPATPVVGWMLHFFIGTIVWGLAFAALYNVIPGGKAWLKGILLGIAAWVLMMIGPMPMAGAGLFGIKLGMAAPIMTLILHVIFGLVLGVTYQFLRSKTDTGQ